MKLNYLVIAVIALFSSAAIADISDTRAQFNKIDTNHDGYINIAEANDGLINNWKEIDVNTDNLIEFSEIAAFDSAKTFVPPVDADEPVFGAAVY